MFTKKGDTAVLARALSSCGACITVILCAGCATVSQGGRPTPPQPRLTKPLIGERLDVVQRVVPSTEKPASPGREVRTAGLFVGFVVAWGAVFSHYVFRTPGSSTSCQSLGVCEMEGLYPVTPDNPLGCKPQCPGDA